MDFLKDVLGEELFKQVKEKVDKSGLKLADISKGDYLPRNKFNEKNDELKLIKEKFDDLQKKSADVEKLSLNNKELQEEIEKINADYNLKLSQNEKKIENMTKTSAIKELLNQNKVVYPELILNGLNLDDIKIKKDGTLDNFNVDSIKEKYPNMFETENIKGNNNATPQTNLGNNQNQSKREELISQYNEHYKNGNVAPLFGLRKQIEALKQNE